MSTFTLDLWFGYSINPDRRGVGYAVRMGALQACDIAESLGDDSPPQIIVRDHGRRRDGGTAVIAAFSATDRDQIDAVVSAIAKRLGSEEQLQKAILRVPDAVERFAMRDTQSSR